MPNNQEQLNELRASVRKANQRLRRIEKAGLETTTPYVMASDYLQGQDRARFRANKRMSEQEVIQELKRVNQFLASQQSTVRGVKKAVARKYSALTGRDVNDFWTETNYSTREIANLLAAFNLVEFKKAGELLGASDQVAEVVREAVRQGQTKGQIARALGKWRREQQDKKQADLADLVLILGL